MNCVEVKCSVCGKIYLREKRRVNEATKHGWNFYCSSSCESQNKTKRITVKCDNPKCGKIFNKQLRHYYHNKKSFCSRSCAATINNSIYPKRKPIFKTCPKCGTSFTGENKYCSFSCQPKCPQVPKEQILKEIKTFYKTNLRIPTKMEFFHSKAARFRFGTWNKAIEAAGYKSNPELFAYKHIAFDGHKCDSFAEFIIDNWLYKKKIPHEIHIPYKNTHFYSDFKVKNTLIEFIGLEGKSKKYDHSLKQKREFIKKQKIIVIEIHPRDLFPKNKLKNILSDIIN